MTYRPCYPMSRSALAKLYLYPEDAIHCFYCGNHPGVGRVKYDFSVIPGGKVCCIVTHVVQKQKTLDAFSSTTGDSSSPAPKGRNPRSSTRISTKENPAKVLDALKLATQAAHFTKPPKPNRSASGQPAATVQSDLNRFCGQ